MEGEEEEGEEEKGEAEEGEGEEEGVYLAPLMMMT